MKGLKRLSRPLASAIGSKFERATESHLNKAGLSTVRRNYRCRAGEIDLIMEDGEELVFVEVRYRTNNDYGDPLESITQAKQKRVARAAAHFLTKEPQYQQRPCRFDAVGVSPLDRGVDYDWIKGAFST